MIDSRLWELISYKKPRFWDSRPLTELMGCDSEAYKTGAPFLFCFSAGQDKPQDDFYCKPKDFIREIIARYLGKNFGVYNLKYDSGAMIYLIPKKRKIELWETGKTNIDFSFVSHSYIHIEYIPHKFLMFSVGEEKGAPRVCFWDISQFYKSSLDTAAKTYLGRAKDDIETKKFSRQFVKDNFKRIVKYCFKDAALTADLGNYLLKKLAEFGIEPSALYSSAFLAYEYFAKRVNIITAWRFYCSYEEMLKCALDSYEGGKFEVTARGNFKGYIYDIVSAYPYETQNLRDVSLCRIEKSDKYLKGATYGFMRVKISNFTNKAIPVGLMINNVRVYPSGIFHATITLQEYEYMRELGVDLDIYEAYYLYADNSPFVYRSVIQELFKIKDKYKKTDRMLFACSKIMLNGIYGKFLQITEREEKYHPGRAWNPLYGSIITANTRIRLCKLQNYLKEHCFAVHTDSIITDRPLPENMQGNKLGDLKYEIEGPMLLIACGQYEVLGTEKTGYKGIKPDNGDTWEKILTRAGNKSKIAFNYIAVESWIEAVAKGHFNRVNLFEEKEKMLNLNVDIKRVWPERVKASDFLRPGFVQQSQAPDYINPEKPDWWPK
jgi:hypothetical protein